MSEFEQKVLKLLEEINGKLDSLLKGGPIAGSVPSASTASTPEITRPKPSEIVEKQEEEAKMEEKPPVEGRRVCPGWIVPQIFQEIRHPLREQGKQRQAGDPDGKNSIKDQFKGLRKSVLFEVGIEKAW